MKCVENPSRGLIQNIFRTAGTNWDSSTSWYAIAIGITAVYISDAACDTCGKNLRILNNYHKSYNIDIDTIRKSLVNTLLSLPKHTPAGERYLPKESFQQRKELVRLDCTYHGWAYRRYRTGDYRVNL